MPRLTDPEFQAMAGLRYALRRFLRFSKELLKRYRLTPEQYEALLALRALSDTPGVSVGELSERLQVRHHTTVALTGRLASASLVTKQRSERDRRQVHVTLTRSGLRLVEQIAQLHRSEIRERSAEMIEVLRTLRR